MTGGERGRGDRSGRFAFCRFLLGRSGHCRTEFAVMPPLVVSFSTLFFFSPTLSTRSTDARFPRWSKPRPRPLFLAFHPHYFFTATSHCLKQVSKVSLDVFSCCVVGVDHVLMQLSACFCQVGTRMRTRARGASC